MVFFRYRRMVFFALLLASGALLFSANAHAASCPVTDGGGGDGDSTVNGVIVISSSTSWTPSDGTAFDCTGVDIQVVNNSTLTIDVDIVNGYSGQINTDNLQVDAGSKISGDAEGCSATGGTANGFGPNDAGGNVCTVSDTGYGDGISGTGGGQGGHHGGLGGEGSTETSGGTTYDSATAPSLFGSSGGNASASAYAGAGGGMVRLNVTGTSTINGEISADGGNGATNGVARSGGGGSGGSIYLTTATITGTGSFTATGGDGGDGSTNDGGGGGGGRIAITYTTSTFDFDNTDFDVSGGSGPGDALDGAKGTVFLEDTDSNIVDIFHGFTYDDTDYSETTWTIDSSATNQYCEAGSTTPSVSATNLTFDGTLNCDASVTSFNWSGSSGFAIGSGSSMTYADELADIDFTIPASTITWTNFTFNGPEEGDFTISDAANLSLVNSTINANVNWTGLASLVIDGDSTISADAKGCNTDGGSNNGEGPDTGTNVCDAATSGYGDGINGIGGGQGGAYGGIGGNGTTEVNNGEVYGSPTAPTLYGSSGGNAQAGASGGYGGGLIRLDTTGNLTVNGALSADGGAGGTAAANKAGGGGSGGSIYLTVGGEMGGAGSFTATGGAGGDNDTNDGGGGGGGRIAITYATATYNFDSSDFTMTAGSGPDSAEDGGLGTVYVKDTTNSAVTIYHGFEYEETDHSETTWTIDSSATNQYCEDGVATPSVTAGTLTLAGTLNCNSASLTSFDWSASSAFSVSASTTVTLTNEGADMDWNVPAASNLALSGVTISMANEGDFTIDDAISLSLESSTAITANAVLTNLTSFVSDSGTVINANEKGCNNPNTANGQGPDTGTNICANTTSGYGDGINGTGGGQGAGYGGAGGDGTTETNNGVTYGSSTAPVIYGSSGGAAGSAAAGGTGGGLIRIASTTMTLNGTLTADGGAGTTSSTARASGGGSGGSIYLSTTCSFSGSTGALSADGGAGGDNDSNDGGGGGGGRISVSYGADSSSFLSGLAASSVVAGGTGPGSAVDGSDGTLNKSDDSGPCFSSAVTGDNDNDGKIDRVIVTMNETLDGASVVGSDWSVTGYTVASSSVTAAAEVTLTLTELGATDSDATPSTSISGSIDDSSANSTTSGSVTPSDAAPPVLLTVTPVEGSTTDAADDAIVLTFSEPMVTSFESGTEYSISPSLGGLSAAFSSGDEVVTISHADFSCGTSYTITTTEAEVDAAAGTSTNLNTSGPEDGDWSFTSQACPSTSSTAPSAPRTFGVGDNSGSSSSGSSDSGSQHGSNGSDGAPDAPTESVDSGSDYTVTWQNTGTVTTGYANVYISYDGGESYQIVASAVKNDGSHRVDLPDAYYPDVRITVALTDLATEVASGQVARFRLGEAPSTSDTDQDTRSFSQPETFTSPVTGAEESVAQVQPGDYITSPSYDTVYFITEDGERRPFMDSQTFFTYEDDFGGVVEVTDATLPTLNLGTPMLPQAGVVLVKVESDPKVYAVEDGGVLRWIQTEETATGLYGVDWADYVIDMPATMFPRFEFGEPVEEPDEIAANILIMKPRFRLAAKAGK